MSAGGDRTGEAVAAPPHRQTDAQPPLERLLEAALPHHRLAGLLPALADCWRTECAVQRVVIGVEDADSGRLHVAEADGRTAAARVIEPPGPLGERGADDRSPQATVARNTEPPAPSLPDPGSVRDLLTAAVSGMEAARWIPLAAAGVVIGGVLLSAESPETPPPSSSWVTVTARLVARARDYEARLLSDKLEAMAEFAAGAAHEINNPLGSIVISAGSLLRSESDPERRRLLSGIGAEAYRARDMISDAMTFARPPRPQPEPLDLAEQVDHVLSRFAERVTERRIQVETDLARPTPIHADRTQLAVVISELLRNAVNAVDDGGRLSVRCRGAEKPGCSQKPGLCEAVLTISDDGCGLTDEQRRHLFDPFYSGRQAGRGLGFGLPKAWRIITNHGGRISVQAHEDRGLTFTVRWPGTAPGPSNPK